MRTGLYAGQSGFYRKPEKQKSKLPKGVKSKDVADPSYFEKVAKDWELSYPNPIRMVEDLFMPPNKKTQEYFDSKKNSNVTPKQTYLKPKTQVTTSTKPTTTVNNQKTTTVNNQKDNQKPTVNSKSEAKSKQTYLKPKGEVNMKVKLFQQMLLDEGMDLGKEGADGLWGPKTQEAFEKLQANKANYAIAMEKFNQMEAALQLKRIEPKVQPVQVDSSPMSRLPEARQGFPTLESAYYKQGGKIEFIYLKQGGKVNGKTAPNNNDENVIPTKEEGGADMNPNFKKLKPKQTTKPAPIYKSKPKVETKEKGGKMGKKCACGCAMKISKNAKGGLIESCACGCGMKKVEKGQEGVVINRKYTNKYPSGSRTYQEKQTRDNKGNQYKRFINTDNTTNKSDTSYYVVNEKYDPNTFKAVNRAFSTNEDFSKAKKIVEDKFKKAKNK